VYSSTRIKLNPTDLFAMKYLKAAKYAAEIGYAAYKIYDEFSD